MAEPKLILALQAGRCLPVFPQQQVVGQPVASRPRRTSGGAATTEAGFSDDQAKVGSSQGIAEKAETCSPELQVSLSASLRLSRGPKGYSS
jgi:hypothetical protein